MLPLYETQLWQRTGSEGEIVHLYMYIFHAACVDGREGAKLIVCIAHDTHCHMYATHRIHTHAQGVSQWLAYTQQEVIRNAAVSSQF